MPRTDPLASLHQLARQLPFLRSDLPITFHTAHAALDVLGALNADFGGTLAQITLPGVAAIALQRLPEPQLRIWSTQVAPPLGEAEVLLDLNSATPEQLPLHVAWAAGFLALCQQHKQGANILIHSDIPPGAGQASLTAQLAALATALLSAGGPPAPLAVAQAVAEAQCRAERSGATSSPSHGHIMNALTALSPRAPSPELLRYSAQPYRLVGPVPLPHDVRILALDTGVRYSKSLLGATLDELRVAAAMGYRIIETIYRDLGRDHTPLQGYLANTSPLLYRQYFRALLPRRLRGSDFARTYGVPAGDSFLYPTRLDPAGVYRVRTAVDHLIAENEHAEQFLQAMEELADAQLTGGKSDAQSLILARAGRLLLASHHSYRLRLELSCREADWLVDRLMTSGPERGIYGARITRAGGGGTLAALLDRSPQATESLLEIMRAYHQLTGLTLGITEA